MTAPRIVVDPDNGLAPWRQIHQQLNHLIRAGALGVDQRLPTVRQLARDLGVAPGTVARVYRELETAGLIRTARGKGTLVADTPSTPTGPAVAVAAKVYADIAAAAGATRDDAVTALLVAWQ